MNTDVLLKINGKDLSEYVTENDLRIKYSPVYDEGSEFTALDGNISRTLLGFRAEISVSFSALPKEAADCLSSLVGMEYYNVGFAFPDLRYAEFETLSLSMEPERTAGDESYWSAYLSARSKVMPLDGL